MAKVEGLRTRRRHGGRLGIAISFVALGAGCSLINSFDDVRPTIDGGPAPTTPDAGSAGLPDALPDAATVDARVGSDAGDAGTADAPAEAEALPPTGVIVLGASAESSDGGTASEKFHFVLTALDAKTGAELPKARETLTVSAVRYDGARDLWYVFEGGGEDFFPSPGDPFFLHVRKLDTHTGQWTELQKLAVPAAVAFTHLAVLANRVVYLAYAPADGSFSTQLVTLNTENPSAVSVIDTQPYTANVVGILGAASEGLTGGTLTLVGSAPGDGGTFVSLTRMRVPNNGPPQIDPNPPNPVDGTKVGGSAGYGSGTIAGGAANIIVTRAFGPPSVQAALTTYNPGDGTPVTSFSFPFIDGNPKPLAFSNCDQVAFVMGTNSDTKLYAVPLATQGVGTQSHTTGHSGQGVYFEPYTKTVLAPFSQGEGYTLTAFSLARADGGIALTPRTAPEWVPPATIRPLIVATREPTDFKCP